MQLKKGDETFLLVGLTIVVLSVIGTFFLTGGFDEVVWPGAANDSAMAVDQEVSDDYDKGYRAGYKAGMEEAMELCGRAVVDQLRDLGCCVPCPVPTVDPCPTDRPPQATETPLIPPTPTATLLPPDTPTPPPTPTPVDDSTEQPKCNKGGGNGSEGCDPGNNPNKGHDDEEQEHPHHGDPQNHKKGH